MRLILLAIALLMSTNCYAFNATTGTITTPTSTGNASVTGLGFTPKVVILYSTGVSSLTSGSMFGFGAATSSSARWSMGAGREDGGAGGGNSRNFSSSKCLTVTYNSGGSGGTWVEADFVSMDADGFTLNWTTVQASGQTVYYLALGGSDLNAKVGTFDSISGTGNQSITGVGFVPSSILIGNTLSNTTEGIITAFLYSMGVAESSSNRYDFGATAASVTNFSSQLSDSVITRVTGGGGSLSAKADLVSMDSDGFTINYSTNSASRRSGYIALNGINVKSGVFNQPTSTGNQSVTGIGFQPKVVMFMSRGLVSSSTIDSNDRFALGVGVSSSSRNSVAMYNADWLGSQCLSAGYSSNSSVITHITEDSPSGTKSILAQADFVSNDSNGFTLNWTVADATAREEIYWAFGQASSVSSSFNGISNMNGVNVN